MKESQRSKGFAQGFICAVCITITMEGGVSTPIRELYEAGGIYLRDFDKYDISKDDTRIIQKYKDELERKLKN